MAAGQAHNLKVGGSSPPPATDVRMPEWSKGVVCKTITHRFESDSLLYAERGSTEVIMAGRTSFLYYSQVYESRDVYVCFCYKVSATWQQ